MRVAIGKQVINGIVIAVLIVLAIAALSIWQYRRIQDTGALVRRTNQVLYQIEMVSATEMQYELNLKNFQLTGDSSFWVVANDSARRLPAKIDTLRTMTADDAGFGALIDSLAMFIAMQHSGSNSGGELVHAPGVGMGRNSFGPGKLGRSDVLGVSLLVDWKLKELEADQRRRLDLRRQISQRKALELQWALWSLSVAVVALAVVAFRQLRDKLGRETEARVASEDKYKMLFYKSPLPKWIFDESSLRFLEVNEAAVRMYGYSEEEFRKLTLADIRPSEDVGLLMDDIQAVRGNPFTYHSSQWRHRRKDGEVMDVMVTAHPVELEGGRARLVTIVDITERRRHERQMQRLNTDLEKRATELSASNAELERFAYIASHDLQEPLRMVTSFLQLLQKKYGGQLDPKADQYIHYAVDGAERMKALIMDLLEYSRVGTGKDGFDWVDCGEVMREVAEMFRERIVAARAQLEVGPLPKVWGDKIQLTQLLQNLLSNALKYASDRPPVIVVRVLERSGCWQFIVQDNGIGIDPQFFDKIFIIFQRLHNKNDYTGTGIGLAICKKIVERHGGKIWLESDREQGSTFFFTINKKA
jgi:PAS domain S-box-containing protein